MRDDSDEGVGMVRMSWRRLWSRAVAGVLVSGVAGVLVGVPAAVGAPTPDAGPTAGGTTVGDALPPEVTLIAVSAGGTHTVALGSDGRAYTWGRNTYGQLGDGSTTDSPVPVAVAAGAVPAGVTFTAVSAGESSSVALGSDGWVYAWGNNLANQLGDGSSTRSPVPVAVAAGAVPAGVTFTAVSAGNVHTLAVGSDGNVYAWGNNNYGQLGEGSTAASSVPVAVAAGAVPAGVTFTAVSAGGFHSLALGSDGKVYAWGNNGSGQLGDGVGVNSSVPVAVAAGAVPAGVTFTAVSAGRTHSLALGSDGRLYAWGSGGDGRLGHGSTSSSSAPVAVAAGAVPAGVTFTAVSAGMQHSAALGSDGQVYAWGYDAQGQLGDGSTTSSSVPVAVASGAVPAGVTFTAVSAGGNQVSAVGSDGGVYAWGENVYGQLGDGSTTGSSVPVAVATGVVVTAVLFDGVPGTNLSQDASGWRVDTPPHVCGPVDVTVEHTQLGVASTSTTTDGFVFGAPPVVTADPLSQPVTAGDSVTLSATATGDEAPVQTWQQDQGAGWVDLPGESGPTVQVTPAATTSYRAVFTNACAQVTTSAATLTVQHLPVLSGQPPQGRVDEPYDFQLTVEGDPAPVVAVDPATPLPAGLRIDATGRITGTPTTAGTSTVTFTATNAAGTVSITRTLVIDPTTNALPDPPGTGAGADQTAPPPGTWLARTGAQAPAAIAAVALALLLAGTALARTRRRTTRPGA